MAFRWRLRTLMMLICVTAIGLAAYSQMRSELEQELACLNDMGSKSDYGPWGTGFFAVTAPLGIRTLLPSGCRTPGYPRRLDQRVVEMSFWVAPTEHQIRLASELRHLHKVTITSPIEASVSDDFTTNLALLETLRPDIKIEYAPMYQAMSTSLQPSSPTY
ncbi:MAG: hypothetical protein ACE361_05520 [Aureliella sp.]